MDAEAFAVSERGSSHVLYNKICQDSAKCYGDDICCIISAADGHGAAPYFRSHKGSNYAANSALKNIKKFMKKANELKLKNIDEYNDFVNRLVNDGEGIIRELFNEIHRDWILDVYDDIEKNPFMIQEYGFLPKEFKAVFEGDEPEFYKAAYGTTLVCAAVCDDFWIGMQLGDGDCVSICGNECKREIPPESCEFDKGFTYSMCSYDAVRKMRFAVSPKIPAAFFVYTDGITNSLDRNEIDDFLLETSKNIFEGDKKQNIKNLEEKLYSISDDGCGDDVSLAGTVCGVKADD